MSNIRFRKELIIILILPLLFSIFLVTNYHFCDHYFKKCLICNNIAYITPLNSTGCILPLLVTLYIINFDEYIPDLTLISTSFRGRAPPYYS